MGRSPQHRSDTGPASVEVLNRADAPAAGTVSRSRPAAAVLVSVTGIALLLVGLVLTPIRLAPEVGRRHSVQVRFGDPFAVEWMALTPAGDQAEAAGRPLPMASMDPACVGFGRLDWPEERRQPTVAHCASTDDIARMSEGAVVLLREILVGPDTWYLLRFGGEPARVEVDLGGDAGLEPDRDPSRDPDRDTDGEEVDPPPIYRAGPYAAILLPNRVSSFEITWELGAGARYRCAIRSSPSC